MSITLSALFLVCYIFVLKVVEKMAKILPIPCSYFCTVSIALTQV